MIVLLVDLNNSIRMANLFTDTQSIIDTSVHGVPLCSDVVCQEKIEIDESLFSRIQHNRGRVLPQQRVFGGAFVCGTR